MYEWNIITDKIYLMLVIVAISILIIAVMTILKNIIINKRLKDINNSIKKLHNTK